MNQDVSYLTAYACAADLQLEALPIKQRRHNMAGTTKKRGFAAMSKEERTRIARMGGKASHGSRKRSV